MIALLFSAMHLLVYILPWVLMAGWIISMADPSSSWAITRVLNAISAPYLRLVSGLLPRVGALDISPLLIVLLSIIVNQLLYMLY